MSLQQTQSFHRILPTIFWILSIKTCCWSIKSCFDLGKDVGIGIVIVFSVVVVVIFIEGVSKFFFFLVLFACLKSFPLVFLNVIQ